MRPRMPVKATLTSTAVNLAQRVLEPFGYAVVRRSGREATIRADDRMLVSYPRSGNTWLSFLLTTLEHLDDPTTFANLEPRCPDIYGHTDRFFSSLESPRLMKSHEPFTAAYRRVLYLVRDPRDVAVSYHRFLLKLRTLDERTTAAVFLDGFLEGRWGEGYGSWGEHVGSWLGARRNSKDFRLLRYEDLHADPVARLRDVATFLGIDASEEAARRAVELCTPERMRAHEQREADLIPQLDGSLREIPFIGSATVGRGRSELAPAQVRRIEAAWGELMGELGYDVQGDDDG